VSRSVKSAPDLQFIEVRYAPLWLLITGIIFSLSLSLALLPRVGMLYSAAVLAVTSTGILRLWFLGKSPVWLNDKYFSVGRAKIERTWIGDVHVLDQPAFLERIRSQSTLTDYLALRNLQYGGVVMSIKDASDPYKYWVVSMRRGNELGELLKRDTGV